MSCALFFFGIERGKFTHCDYFIDVEREIHNLDGNMNSVVRCDFEF